MTFERELQAFRRNREHIGLLADRELPLEGFFEFGHGTMITRAAAIRTLTARCPGVVLTDGRARAPADVCPGGRPSAACRLCAPWHEHPGDARLYNRPVLVERFG